MGGDLANINSVSGKCGLAKGMPQRSDGSDSVHLEQGSEWTVPLYYCASASRALIKIVSFSVDNTTSLAGIQVTRIAEKTYRDASEYPIWAVENTGRNLSTVRPLWGLAESEESPLEDISFKRHPHLWLTGYEIWTEDEAKGDEYQNLAGLQFYSMALGVAYSVGNVWDVKYSGGGSLPMYNRWKELTESPEGTAKVVSLIWTDVSANAVVGTQGQMPQREPPGLGPAYKGGRDEKVRRAGDGRPEGEGGARRRAYLPTQSRIQDPVRDSRLHHTRPPPRHPWLRPRSPRHSPRHAGADPLVPRPALGRKGHDGHAGQWER